MIFEADTRPLEVYRWADGSGFGWKSPGDDLLPETGYFEESPFLTVDVDAAGRIVDVGFALDPADGKPAKDVQCRIARHCNDASMTWEMTFPQGTLLTCDSEEVWRAAGSLAETLSATLTPHGDMLTVAITSRKLQA